MQVRGKVRRYDVGQQRHIAVPEYGGKIMTYSANAPVQRVTDVKQMVLVTVGKAELERYERAVDRFFTDLNRLAEIYHSASDQPASKFVYEVQRLYEAFVEPENDMRKTYSIELKINFNDDTRHDAVMEIMRNAARKVLTQAVMIADGRDPKVALRTEDYFEGITDKDLQTDEEKETRVL